jgi:hypothetical protein
MVAHSHVPQRPQCFSYCCRPLGIPLLALLVTSTGVAGGRSLPADTIPVTSRHIVKLGVRYGSATSRASVTQLRYEWLVRPTWSLQAGSGYGRNQYIQGSYRRVRSSYWTADLSALHYLNSSRPQLTGLYVGIGVGTVYRSIQDQDIFTLSEDNRQDFGLESRVQLGVQKSLSRRLALQVYAATSFIYFFGSFDGRSWGLAPELGLSLGYRL